ncbi:fused response regulator/phosphatase [Colwellia asteriadis]|uniref:Fused response regulator/phosphatase n=1 Tax=Colwellia asteriadis TaxID=517723 RepID=A0ABP3WH85_9GAMM
MPSSKNLVLIVDDSKVQCKVLSALLEEDNYRVIVANDGATGVEMFITHQPDLVLMDVNMPIMNGYEATRRIKAMSGVGNLAPLMFITSMGSDESFINCVEAGGDSILVRPFSSAVFKAKIKALQRISDLVEQVKSLQHEQKNDAELAEKMMSEVIESRNYGLDRIGVIKKPAALFSGDIQLSALSPNGNIHVLLGDFTGHGLRSSIGAIPITETFRVMTKKGFSISDIIMQINSQLYTLLPGDLFFAAGFACISEHEKSAYVLNAGLPDAYLFNEQADIKHQFSSKHPPLGILPEILSDVQLDIINIHPHDRLVFLTDGIIEARNQEGEYFGSQRFETAVKEGVIEGDIAKNIQKKLADFCKNTEQEDDISLVDIPCCSWINNNDITVISSNLSDELSELDNSLSIPLAWSYHLHLTGKLLKNTNPIPLVMNQINDLEGAGEHWQSLYTILTELFVNALDHGVLKLDSALKNSPEGFSSYFNERTQRLNLLQENKQGNAHEDFVRISLQYYPLFQGGKMLIKIKDSGVGFNVLKVIKTNSQLLNTGMSLSGRGINIVDQLCDTLEYQEDGTLVIASYIWRNKQVLD